ncbi:hypothetical protein Tco_0104869 [Tanacetum coccineum]
MKSNNEGSECVVLIYWMYQAKVTGKKKKKDEEKKVSNMYLVMLKFKMIMMSASLGGIFLAGGGGNHGVFAMSSHQDEKVVTLDENTNPPPTRPVLPALLCARYNQELQELLKISAFVDSRLESIERFLNRFADQRNETSIDDLESDDGSVNTPLVSPFPHSENDSDDEEVLNELSEYENTRTLRHERIINSFDRDNLAFECMIGFRKFTSYLDPFLPINIISRKAYNTIMVDRLEGTGKNLVSIVDVYVFVRSFTYIIDFVVLNDIGEFIMSDMAEVLMGIPFRKTTKLKYDVSKGLVSFTKIFDTCTYRMPRKIPRLKNFN